MKMTNKQRAESVEWIISKLPKKPKYDHVCDLAKQKDINPHYIIKVMRGL